MADPMEYQKKMENLQKYIPFLVNMMAELKAKGNREAQLNKIKSLHEMITDKKKKLKLETLNRCEEVLSNIYCKVNPQLKIRNSLVEASPSPIYIKSPSPEPLESTPASPSPTREIYSQPVTIPTEKVPCSNRLEHITPRSSYLPKVNVYSSAADSLRIGRNASSVPDVYSSAAESLSKSPRKKNETLPRTLDITKPPISLDDLKTLEDDVQEKMHAVHFANTSMSELTDMRKKLQLQLRVDSINNTMSPETKDAEVNTTVKTSLSTKIKPEKAKIQVKESPSDKNSNSMQASPKNSDANTKPTSTPVKDSTSSTLDTKSVSTPLKESDSIFGNLLSSIDSHIIEETKKFKKDERRSSTGSKEDKHKSSNKGKHESKSAKDKFDVTKTDNSKMSTSKDKSSHKDTHKVNDADKSDKAKSVDKKSNDKEKDKRSSKLDHKKQDGKDSKHKERSSTESKKKSSGSKDKEKPKSEKPETKKDKSSSKEKSSISKESEKCSKENGDKKQSTNTKDTKHKCSKSKEGSDMDKSMKESIEKIKEKTESQVDKPKTTEITAYRRLADKYNPKPKKQITDQGADVDVDVVASIEKNMRTAPPVSLPVHRLEEPIPPSVSLVRNLIEAEKHSELQQPSVKLPELIQNILNPKKRTELSNNVNIPLLNHIPTIVNSPQMRSNNSDTSSIISPPSIMSPPNCSGVLPAPTISSQNSGGGILQTPNVPIRQFQNNMNQVFQENDTDSHQRLRPLLNVDMVPPIPFANVNFLQNRPVMQAEMQQHNRMSNFGQNYQPGDNFNAFGNFNSFGMDDNSLNMHQHQQMDFFPGNQNYHLHQQESSLYMPQEQNPMFFQDRDFHYTGSWGNERRWNNRHDARASRDPRYPRSYGEYKELREKEARENNRDPRQLKPVSEENTRDPRLNKDPRNVKDNDSRGLIESKDPRLSREIRKDPRLERDKKTDTDQDLQHSKDKDSKDDMSRTAQEETLAEKSIRRNRYDSKFDKLYSRASQNRSRSSSGEEEETFVSPLDSLYATKDTKRTGKGYGVQNFKIPKKVKNKDDRSRKNEEQVISSSKVSSSQEEEVAENVKTKSKVVRKKIVKLQIEDDDEDDAGDIHDNIDTDINNDEESIVEKSNTKKSKTDGAKKVEQRNTSVGLDTETEAPLNEPENPTKEPEEPEIEWESAYSGNSKIIIDDDTSWNTSVEIFIGPGHVVEEEEEIKELRVKINKAVEGTLSENELHDNATDIVSSTVTDEIPVNKADEIVDDKDIEKENVQEDGFVEQRTENAIYEPQDDNNKVPTTTQCITSEKTIQEILPPQKSEDHAEQNILAQFFEKLLKSKNKKDKKVALASLIETFSDSFSSKQMKKITQIFERDDENEQESEEETLNDIDSENLPDEKEKEEEKPENDESGSISEVSLVVTPTKKGKRLRRLSSTTTEDELLIQDQQKRDALSSSATSKTDISDFETSHSEQDKNLIEAEETIDPIIMSVGERIKSRKRNITKPKKKNRSELDWLHEDIQDMFIRDGVLTATGKRMCRILKDDPNALSTPNTGSKDTTESEKKLRKKPGPKVKPKPPTKEQIKSMKNVRVILKKIPLAEENVRTLRSKTRSSQIDSEVEENKSGAESNDSDSSNGSDNESIHDKEQDTKKAEKLMRQKAVAKKSEKPHKVIAGKARLWRQKSKWASGIIAKKKKKQNKPATASKEPSPQPELDLEPDKEYFIDRSSLSQKPLPCKLCDYVGRFLVSHYVQNHPDSEVLCSRFSPQIAEATIKDCLENSARYESVRASKLTTKYKYVCRFCEFEHSVFPLSFYEHVTTHTGEYRHNCGICEYKAANGKQLISHFNTVHPKDEKKARRQPLKPSALIFGYMCGECNFVQLKKETVDEHANIFHLGDKPIIYKINLSTFLDPIMEIDEFDKDQQVESKALIQSKPGPKSKKKFLTNLNTEPTVVRKKFKAAPKSVKKAKEALMALEKEKETTLSEEDEIPDSVKQSKVVKMGQASTPKPHITHKNELERLIANDDDEKDLEKIISVSRTGRAAKEKATAKLRTLMEAGENLQRKKSETNITSTASSKEVVASKKETNNKNIAEPMDFEENKSNDQNEVDNVKPEDVPPKIVDTNIFTCAESVEQEEKKIEEERLKKMNELNKSIGLRSVRLDFTDKLCNRLNSSNNSSHNTSMDSNFSDAFNVVKNEPVDEDTTSAMPVLERETVLPVPSTSSVAQPSVQKSSSPRVATKKPVLEDDMPLPSPRLSFPQNKNNTLFSNMIEKLQGKVSEAAKNFINCPEDTERTSEKTKSSNDEIIISISGYINVSKGDENGILLSCIVNDCGYSNKNKVFFKQHCKLKHYNIVVDTICDKCGEFLRPTENISLMENMCDHIFLSHNDLIESALFVKPIGSVLRMRKLSGDKLSLKKDEDDNDSGASSTSAPPEVNKDTQNAVEQEDPIPTVAQIELAPDNPFSFKITDVVSLAEPEITTSPVLKVTETTPPPLKDLDLQLPPLLRIQKVPASTQLVIKEVKLTQAEMNRSRKTVKALGKFIENVGDLYKCPHYYCMFTTNFREYFERHLKAHQSETEVMIPCVYCDLKTPWDHVPTHIDVRHAHCKYVCSYCLYRAVVKEYVHLHQDLAHPEKDYSVIALPTHKHALKFSLSEHKVDPKSLCEPYRCAYFHSPVEFLFENNFHDHLINDHDPQNTLQCSYKNCSVKCEPSKMVNHWNFFHSIWPYQCGHCKVSSGELPKMYQHFSKIHQGLTLDILVRKSSQPNSGSLEYSATAFQNLTHVKELPTNLITKPGLIRQLPPAPEKPTASAAILSTDRSPTNSAAKKVPVVSPPKPKKQVIISNQKFKYIVTSSSGSSSNNILLVPNAMVTSVAANNNLVKTSTAGVVQGPHVPSTQPELSVNTLLVANNIVSLGSALSPIMPTKAGPKIIISNSNSALSGQNILYPVAQQPNSTGLILTTTSAPSGQAHKIISVGSPINTASLILTTTAAPIDVNTKLSIISSKSSSTSSILTPTTFLPIVTSTETHKITPVSVDSIINKARTIRNSTVNAVKFPVVSAENGDKNIKNTQVPTQDQQIDNLDLDTEHREPLFSLVTPVEHIDLGEEVPDIQDGDDSNDVDPLAVENPLAEENPLEMATEDPLITDPLRENSLTGDPLVDSPLKAGVLPALEVPSIPKTTGAKPKRTASIVSTSDDEEHSTLSEGKRPGLLGYQLYRCGSCVLSYSNLNDFKMHVINSVLCKREGLKPFKCAHCDRTMKTPQRLIDHVQCHGILRFSCSLCVDKFPSTLQVRGHMKYRHNVTQTTLVPLKSDKNNLDLDEFVMRPILAHQVIPGKETQESLNKPSSTAEMMFMPEEIDKIPPRQIFMQNVKCGRCNYQTKVRINIVRHLQMHAEEKAVPDTAPVNPVPCLEKNEKMFDKMTNLAASSFTGTTRMGGGNKESNEKDEDKIPEFVPIRGRFVCCAKGCNYMCPEEGNLRHHLIALHSDESEFVCAHCKRTLKPHDADNLIKHFKMHGLQLYKCHYCDFVHNLKHKVEKHVGDQHTDVPVKYKTVRHMDSEPETGGSDHSAPAVAILNTSKFKPWRCRMCKYKCANLDEIQAHITTKHDIDARFKCTLCTYKSDEKDTFDEHFKVTHPSHNIDIIDVYTKVEEEVKKDDKDSEKFDTTPLWQRDKPRVRHIRGILFDEDMPTSKSPKKSSKSAVTASPVTPISKASTSSSASNSPSFKNLFDCIEAVANGTAATLHKEPTSSVSDDVINDLKRNMPNKEDLEIAKRNTPNKAEVEDMMRNTIIVLDDDDDDVIPAKIEDDVPKEKNKDNKNNPQAKNRGFKRKLTDKPIEEGVSKLFKPDETEDVVLVEDGSEIVEEDIPSEDLSEQTLIAKYGTFGTPNNKQWKCPCCYLFRSKRINDFIFHVFKDKGHFRFSCNICEEASITYKYMKEHIKMHPNSNDDSIKALPSNLMLETWIQMVIQCQSSAILKQTPQATDNTALGDISCSHCDQKFKTMLIFFDHLHGHWSQKPYKCDHCDYEGFSPQEIKHHHKNTHKDSKLELSFKKLAPIVAETIKSVDDTHMFGNKRPLPKDSPNTSTKKPKVDNVGSPSIVSKISEISRDNKSDDLMMVLKSDKVPNENEVFACQLCPTVTDEEHQMQSHLSMVHGVIGMTRYKVINKTEGLDKRHHVACSICHHTDSEFKVRQHFLENHGDKKEFAIYKYLCGYCATTSLTLRSIKMHTGRKHIGQSYKYSIIGEDQEKIAKQIKKHQSTKYKLYKCHLCNYSNVNCHTNNIRHHIRGHCKPMICEICQSPFKYLKDAQYHSKREHPNEPENITTSVQKVHEYNKFMEQCIKNAEVVSTKETQQVKSTARKSTSAIHKIIPEQEQYSFYGQKPEQIDFRKITTTVEVNQMIMTMTADQLGKIFNLSPDVVIEDCDVIDFQDVFEGVPNLTDDVEDVGDVFDSSNNVTELLDS